MRNASGLIVGAILAAGLTLTNQSNATAITGTSLFLDNRFNDITFGSQGARLHVEARVDDVLGVPDNIVSVRATHATSGHQYNLGYAAKGNFSTPTFAPYIRSRLYSSVPAIDRTGRYIIEALNAQGAVVSRQTQFLNAAEQLSTPSNLHFSGSNRLAPHVTADAVAGADQYQLRIWDSADNRLYNSLRQPGPTFAVPAGILSQSNSYAIAIEALDLDGFGNLERRSVTFAPYVTPLPPTRPVVSGLFDKNKPTIVVTHGWQPGLVTPDDVWWRDMINDISKRPLAGTNPPDRDTYGETYNIGAIEWGDAYKGISFTDVVGFLQAKASVSSNGSALAQRLVQELGADYKNEIHFIGHSLGTIVNAAAVDALTDGPYNWNIGQFTILDAPLKLPLIDYPKDYFRRVLPENAVNYVDNYYGTSSLAVGADICGNTDCAYNRPLDRSHSGVREYYGETIANPSIQDGFFYDLAGGGGAARPNSPWDPGAEETPLVAVLQPELNAAWIPVGNVTLLANEARLFPSSPAAIATSLFIPDDADYLSFDFLFEHALGDEFLTVLLDDTPVFSFLASSVFQPDTYQNSGLLPIDQFAGGIHKLTYWLDGDPGMELGLRNIAFSGSAAVPEPGTAFLFLPALIVLWRLGGVRRGMHSVALRSIALAAFIVGGASSFSSTPAAAQAITKADLVGYFEGDYSSNCNRGAAQTVALKIEDGAPMRGQFTNPFGTWNTPVSLRDGKILMSIDFARREWEGVKQEGTLRLTTKYTFYSDRSQRDCTATVWLDKSP